MAFGIKDKYIKDILDGKFEAIDIAKKDLEKIKEAEKIVVGQIEETEKLKEIIPSIRNEGAKNDLRNIQEKKQELEEFNEQAPYLKENVIQYKNASDELKIKISSIKKENNLELSVTELMQKTAQSSLDDLIPKFPENEIKEKYPDIYDYYQNKGGLERGIELFDERKEILTDEEKPKPLKKEEILCGLSRKAVEEYFEKLSTSFKPNRSTNHLYLLMGHAPEKKKKIEKRIKQLEKYKKDDEENREIISNSQDEYLNLADKVNNVREKINTYHEDKTKKEKAIPKLKQARQEFLKKMEGNLIFDNFEKYERDFGGRSKYLEGVFVYHKEEQQDLEINKYENIKNKKEELVENNDAQNEIDAAFKELKE